MIKLIPGTINLWIDKNCEFYVYHMGLKKHIKWNIPVFQETTNDGKIINKVRIKLYNIHRECDVQWLMRLAMTESFFENAYDNITFADVYALRSPTVWYRVIFKKPVYYDDTHRIIPGYSRYAISKDGECISIATKSVGRIIQRESDYLYSCVYDPKINHTRDIALHILVALAWVPNDYPEIKTQVNHKDGNKHHCHASNLEWVTHRENVIHSWTNGLMNKRHNFKNNIEAPTAFRVRNIKTGIIKRFESLNSAIKYMQCNLSDIENYDENIPINDKFEFRRNDDNRPWILHDEEYKSSNKFKNGTYVFVVKNKKTNETMSFNGVYAFRKYFKIWNISLNKDNILDIFYSKYSKDDYEVTLETNLHVNSKIEVRNIKTNEVIEIPTTRKLATFMGRSQSTVTNNLSYNGSRVYYNDRDRQFYCYRWKIDEPWPEINNSK